MNGVAHYLAGLLFMLLVVKLFPKGESFKFSLPMALTVFVVTFFSHILIDALAHVTYHPSDSDWGDPVYAGWHLLTYVGEFVFAIYFLRTDIRNSVPMIGAVGFDLWDWSIRRGLGFESLPEVHFMAEAFRNALIRPILPDLTLVQWALIFEVIFVILTFLWWKKWHASSELGKNPRRSSWLEVAILVAVFGFLRLLTLV